MRLFKLVFCICYEFVSEVGVICQLGRYVSSWRMSQPPTMARTHTHTHTHTHRYTLHAWKQPVLSVRSKLPPLWLECSWRDRREEKRWSARGAISYTFTEATGRSITNTHPHPPALTSHISCLAPARSKPQTGEKKNASNFEFISRCLKTQNKSPCDIISPNRKWLKRWKDEIKMAHAGLLFYIFHY